MSEYYECVECQRLHFAPSYMFDYHVKLQSKRGILHGDSPADTFSKWISGRGATDVAVKNAYRVTYVMDGIAWYASHIHPDDDVKFTPHWSIHKQGFTGTDACYQQIDDTEVTA